MQEESRRFGHKHHKKTGSGGKKRMQIAKKIFAAENAIDKRKTL